jgi:hypothetical protein
MQGQAPFSKNAAARDKRLQTSLSLAGAFLEKGEKLFWRCFSSEFLYLSTFKLLTVVPDVTEP